MKKFPKKFAILRFIKSKFNKISEILCRSSLINVIQAFPAFIPAS